MIIVAYTVMTIMKSKNNSEQPVSIVDTTVEAKVNNIEILEEELQRLNEITALEGTRDIKTTYKDTDLEMKVKNKGNPIGFLINKFNESQSKYLTIQTTYKYIFTYNLSNIKIHNQNRKNVISLHCADLVMKPLMEEKGVRKIEDQYGLFADKFTPQEVSGLMEMTMVRVMNNINSDNNIQNIAIENVKRNIEELIHNLGIEDVEIVVYEAKGLIDNSNVEVR